MFTKQDAFRAISCPKYDPVTQTLEYKRVAQVHVSPTWVPLVVTVAGVMKVGSVFKMVSDAASVALPLLVSVTVTEHSTTSVGLTVVGFSCSVLAVDTN